MPTIITCGVYGFTAESFENAIVAAKPDVFVDTRRRRGVRGKRYSFANSQRLQEMLAHHDITYVHHKDLAPTQDVINHEGEIDDEHNIARHDRDSLSDEFVKEYSQEVLNDFNASAFIESLGDVERVLIFCVEKTPSACHRGLLADAIVDELGWEREDLIDDKS